MKKKIEIPIHQPSVLRIFRSMTSCPKWVKLLEGKGKEYQPFLMGLIEANFFADIEEKATIKLMAERIGFKREAVTKWIKEMYEDIFELNYESPDLFKSEGIKHSLHFKGYDTSAYLTLWLKSTPRVYEKMNFYFLDAKIGSRIYWVKDVHHDFDDEEHTITLFIESGICNVYREQLVYRALYEGVLGFMDTYQKKDYEIDKELKSFYK